MKKIVKILSIILLFVCCSFTFCGCGPNPMGDDEGATNAMLDNFLGIKAIYVPKKDRPNLEAETAANKLLLDEFSTSVLGSLASSLDVTTLAWNAENEDLFTQNYKELLTAQLANLNLGLEGADALKIDGSETEASILDKLKNFSGYGLTSENLNSLKGFIIENVIGGGADITTANDTANLAISGATTSVLEAKLGEGKTFVKNLYVQNYSMDFLKAQINEKAKSDEGFFLPEEEYVSIIYLVKPTVQTVMDENETNIRLHYGFWQLRSAMATNFDISSTLMFVGGNNFSFNLTADSDDEDFYLFYDGTEDGELVLKQGTSQDDKTGGGSPAADTSGTPVTLIESGGNFNKTLISSVTEGQSGTVYDDANLNMFQIVFSNPQRQSFAFSGIESLLFEKN